MPYLGAVGLDAVMGCCTAGLKKITGDEVNPDKFKKTEVFGAT